MFRILKFLIQFLIIRPVCWIIKFFAKLMILSLVILAVILLAGNFWLPKLVELELSKRSGFTTSIRKSSGSIFGGQVDFKGLEIKNPIFEFKNEDFIKLNRLTADVDLISLTKDKVIVEELIIDLDNITLLKNSNGDNNYSRFIKNIENSIHRRKPVASETKTASKSEKSIFVQKFVLYIGSVTLADEGKETSKEYQIGYRREFTNVSDFSALSSQLTKDLSKYGMSMIVDSVISSIADLPSTAVDGVIKVKDMSVDTIGKVGKSVGKAGSKLGKEVGGIVKKLFGGK